MNHKDLIDAELADVLLVPYLRAYNLMILSEGVLQDHWARKVPARKQMIADALERRSDGRDPL